MKLADYLDAHSIPRAQFAERIGVSDESVRRYIVGDRRPNRRTLEKIALATACKVTANDFFGISPQRAA